MNAFRVMPVFYWPAVLFVNQQSEKKAAEKHTINYNMYVFIRQYRNHYDLESYLLICIYYIYFFY